MNSLSWLIYLAELTGSLQGAAIFGLVCSVLWFAGLQIGGAFAADFPSDPETAASRRTLSLKAIPFGAVFLLLSCIIPSKTTVYAIAASEMGESALNTETGGKAVKALNAWLDHQIANDKPEGKAE